MSRQLVVRRRARRDVERVATWYHAERPGLGDEFVGELDSLLVRLLEDPRQFPVISDTVRRGLVRRFPYAVYFLEDANRVVVLAVVHLHRHPDAWMRIRGETR